MNEKNKFVIKNTLGMFDLIKGITMIMVMFFHTYGLLDIVEQFSASDKHSLVADVTVMSLYILLMTAGCTLMPILFIVSGYNFRRTTFSKCVKKQTKSLMVPYIVTGVMVAAVDFIWSYTTHWGWFLFSVKHAFSKIVGYAFGIPQSITVGGFYITGCGPVWFLLAMAIGNVIVNQLSFHFDGIKLLIISFLVATIGWLITLWVPLIWCISQGLVATFFISLGHFAKKAKFFSSGFNIKKLAIMIVDIIATITLICIGGRNTVNMVSNHYLFGTISVGVVGTFGLFLTQLVLYCNKFSGRISTFIRGIGRDSLYVLCIHTIEYIGVSLNIHYDIAANWKGNIYIRCLIIFAVRIVIVLVGTRCYLKMKEKYMNKVTKA